MADILFNLANNNSINWAKKHAAELITNISKTTRERIREEVVSAFEDGMGPDELVNLLEDLIGDEVRAQLIADTETMIAANEGQRQAWNQATDEGLLSGREKREWIATGDTDVCDECDELNGKTTNLDGVYPGDGEDGPPLHPRCRCTEGIVYG